jgi:hypothetical protein
MTNASTSQKADFVFVHVWIVLNNHREGLKDPWKALSNDRGLVMTIPVLKRT